MSSVAPALERALSEVVLTESKAETQRTRRGQQELATALDDFARGDLDSAGCAIRRSLVLQPFDPAVQDTFRLIENNWRRQRYARQDWRDSYLSARIAFQARDLTTAAVGLVSLERHGAMAAPSFSDYARALELEHAINNQIAALEGASQLAAAWLDSGRRAEARALCQRYLAVAPGFEWLVQVARQCELPAGEPIRRSASSPLPLPGEPDPLTRLSSIEPVPSYPPALAAAAPGFATPVRALRGKPPSDLAHSTVSPAVLSTLQNLWMDSLATVVNRVRRVLDRLEHNELLEARDDCGQCAREFPDYPVFRHLSAQIEARIAAQHWAFCEEVLDRAAGETDLTRRAAVLSRALTVAPDEALFRRELDLTSKELLLPSKPDLLTWRLPPADFYRVQPWQRLRPSLRRKAGIGAGVLAAAAILTFVFLPQQHRSDSSPRVSRPPVSASPVSVPPVPLSGPEVQVVSHVPFSLFLDFKPIYRSDSGVAHTVNVPAGDHVLSIAHGDALLHLFTKEQAGLTATEVHPDGLPAVVIHEGSISLAGARPYFLSLDGSRLRGPSLPPISSGAHRLVFDRQLFAFTVSPSEPLVLITAAESNKGKTPELVSTAQQRALEGRAHGFVASLRTAPAERVKEAPVSPPPIVVGSESQLVMPPAPSLSPSAAIPPAPKPARPVRRGEDDEIAATLQSYSQAWRAKDLDRITALRPSLNKHSVREDLEGVKSISMDIRPTGAVHIEGNTATVECVHQVTQTFRDGVQKRSPEVSMTYVLVRRNGRWVIDRTH